MQSVIATVCKTVYLKFLYILFLTVTMTLTSKVKLLPGPEKVLTWNIAML